MKETLSDQQNEAILKALDEAIQNGPWDKSNFLRALGKNLSDIRENFVRHMSTLSQAQIKTQAQTASRMALRTEQQEVFISLYSSDGTNLQSWEKIIVNLPRQMISRPIYSCEDHVKTVIKSKENKQNEAYIAIYVNKTDIINLSSDKAMVDKMGHPLITVKDKTLVLENISRFTYYDGVLQFNQGHLVAL